MKNNIGGVVTHKLLHSDDVAAIDVGVDVVADVITGVVGRCGSSVVVVVVAVADEIVDDDYLAIRVR
jgi:hypothetical protein